MKNKITKLNSDNLWEVSGGLEADTRNPWAKELGAIDPENGEQMERKTKGKENSIDNDMEEVQ